MRRAEAVSVPPFVSLPAGPDKIQPHARFRQGAARTSEQRVEEDLKLPGLPREKVLAAVVKLLETTCMRIGNDEYKQQNDSYGLTTLQDHHVKVEGSRMQFKFRGKSGQQQDIELNDPRLAKIVKRAAISPDTSCFSITTKRATWPT